MDVKLVVLGGKNAGMQLAVAGAKYLIGRGEDCQLRPGSDQISRHHCAILVEEGKVTVEDYGSTNGTYVNQQRVQNNRELRTGDHLRIGPLEFEVQLTVNVGGKKKPKIQTIQEAAARTAQSATKPEDLDVAHWLDSGDVSPDDTINEILAQQRRAEGSGDTKPAIPTSPTKASKPEQSKQEPPNSRDAAADLLRQLFGKGNRK
jgi:predicted component of type VI protein secretion system